MEVGISARSGVLRPTGGGIWSVSLDRKLLISTLREAAGRASQDHPAVLASFTQPVEWCDAVQAFAGARSAGLGECLYWEQPAEQHALVGIGTAATIESDGEAYLSDASMARRVLMEDAVITYAPATVLTPASGPVLFGGFAFDPLAPGTSLWSGFPAGLLILSRFLISCSAGRATLTINRLVRASDAIEQSVQEIEASASALQAAINQSQGSLQEGPSGQFSVYEEQPASAWMEMVATMTDMIQHGAFDKVVLARDVRVDLHDASGAFDIVATLGRLRESYPAAYVFAVQRGERFFVGATPERLARVRDGQIHTMALAGSARRGETEADDEQLGAELLRSQKNNSEHAIVVAMVREALKKHCASVYVHPVPQLLKLKNVQHLKTPITGELIPGRCVLDVIADLHPTPAVGGFPRQAALEAIRSTERLDRGWYAGPLGWVNASGEGEFAVALRSGLIDGARAVLFAGCGIVADSDPQAEYAESCLKFEVMLRALGGEPLAIQPAGAAGATTTSPPDELQQAR
jgi:menaquinone-specific isochorismate synthase